MLEQNLQEIGLNEKEARVYLAALELGQSTVQDISKKSQVNRATAYFVIEALMRHGLMSSVHKGKKQYFMAADPVKLLEIVGTEKEIISKREASIKKILPQLESVNNKVSNKPIVRYYEGKEGILTMLDEYIEYAKGTISMAYSVDELNKVFSEEEKKKARQRRYNKDLRSKVIYTFEAGELEKNTEFSKRRKVPFKDFPIKSDIAVYADKVRIATYGNRLAGIVIDDQEIAGSIKAILDLAWEGAEKYQ